MQLGTTRYPRPTHLGLARSEQGEGVLMALLQGPAEYADQPLRQARSG
jgi:hypothetical protein